jgi:hypothetical protein
LNLANRDEFDIKFDIKEIITFVAANPIPVSINGIEKFKTPIIRKTAEAIKIIFFVTSSVVGELLSFEGGWLIDRVKTDEIDAIFILKNLFRNIITFVINSCLIKKIIIQPDNG